MPKTAQAEYLQNQDEIKRQQANADREYKLQKEQYENEKKSQQAQQRASQYNTIKGVKSAIAKAKKSGNTYLVRALQERLGYLRERTHSEKREDKKK